MHLEILDLSVVNETLRQRIRELFNQLNAKIRQRDIDQVLADDNTIVFVVCKEDEALVGMASMATYKVVSGHKGMVEDVVVDPAHRGKGIGRQLMQKLLEEGKKQGLDEILLFSGHHRTAAISLYQSLGFHLKDSGLYTLKLNERRDQD